MSISPITLPTGLNPNLQEVAVQNNPAAPQVNPGVQAVTAQVTSAPQPVQQNALPAQVSQLTQIQQLYLEGQSISQIASEIGLSVSDIDIELGITPASTTVTAAASVGSSGVNAAAAPAASAANSTASPGAPTATAIAAYKAAPQATESVGANQSQAGTSSSTISVAA